LSRHAVRALLADSKAAPDDDAPRLILADFLDDHGDQADRARADLLRAQVRREPGAPALARAHIQEFGQTWLGPLAPWATIFAVERGLLAVTVAVPSLRSGGMRRLADEEAWAWVDHLSLGSERATVTGHLAHCPLLAGLSSFNAGRLRGQGPEVVRELAEAPWMASVRRLVLAHLEMTGRDLAPLIESPHVEKLEHLDLEGCPLGVAGIRALAAAAWARRLRSLGLRRAWLTDSEAAALADAEGLAGLRDLDLRDNQIGAGGALALAASMYLGRLETLRLYGNQVGPEGAEALRRRFGSRAHLA